MNQIKNYNTFSVVREGVVKKVSHASAMSSSDEIYHKIYSLSIGYLF